MFAWGIGFYGPSVYLRALQAGPGIPVGAASAAVTLHFLFSAALIARLPAAHRRFGLVAVTRAGAVALAAGALLWGIATEPWHLVPAALATGLGWAATSGAAINAMVAPWFDRRRPAALAMAYNGASAGGIVMVPAWTALIAWLGFAPAAALVAAATLLLLWPLAGAWLRDGPEAHGLAPDGDPRPAAPPAPAAPRGAGLLLRDPGFATLSLAFALGLFAQIGLIAHLVTLLAPRLGDGGAAAALSLATVCAVLGRSAMGALIGGTRRRAAAAGNFAVQAAGTLLLAWSGGPDWAALLGCLLFGLGIGNLLSLPPLIAQVEFPRAEVASVVALVTAINQAVYAFAPGLLGLLREATGGYGAPLALAVAAQLAAAAVVLARPGPLSPPPAPPSAPRGPG
jgi:predicted MFS family arabinose efflux permease